MTEEPTNENRAQWAREALIAFTARTWGGRHPDTMDRGDLECAVYDLIADLLHYADRQGFETDSVLASAVLHFEAEQREEAQNA
jgi:hypothetical protein